MEKTPSFRDVDLAERIGYRYQMANRELRSLVPMLGRRYTHSHAKASRLLGWDPRPARTTVLECAASLR